MFHDWLYTESEQLFRLLGFSMSQREQWMKVLEYVFFWGKAPCLLNWLAATHSHIFSAIHPYYSWSSIVWEQTNWKTGALQLDGWKKNWTGCSRYTHVYVPISCLAGLSLLGNLSAMIWNPKELKREIVIKGKEEILEITGIVQNEQGV